MIKNKTVLQLFIEFMSKKDPFYNDKFYNSTTNFYFEELASKFYSKEDLKNINTPFMREEWVWSTEFIKQADALCKSRLVPKKLDFQTCVKSNVLWKNKDITDSVFYKLNHMVQTGIFNLTEDEFFNQLGLNGTVTKVTDKNGKEVDREEQLKINKVSLRNIYKTLGVPKVIDEYIIWKEEEDDDLEGQVFYSQFQVKIVANAINIYLGVKKRLENFNKEARRHFDKRNKAYIDIFFKSMYDLHNTDDNPKKSKKKEASLKPYKVPSRYKNGERPVFNENGKLSEIPGVNNSIFGAQQSRLRPFTAKDHATLSESFDNLPAFIGAEKTITRHSRKVFVDRRNIEAGKPGHVPEKHIPLLKDNRKRIKSTMSVNTYGQSYPTGPIPYIFEVNDLIVIIDGRSLLRNFYYRKLGKCKKDVFELTPEKLLKYFTSDPVFQIGEGVKDQVSLSLQPMHSKKTDKDAKLVLKDHITNEKEIFITSIDIGETNPIGYNVTKVVGTQEFILEKGPETALTSEIKTEINNIVNKYSISNVKIKLQALMKTDENGKQLFSNEERAKILAAFPYIHDMKTYMDSDNKQEFVSLNDLPKDNTDISYKNLIKRIREDLGVSETDLQDAVFQNCRNNTYLIYDAVSKVKPESIEKVSLSYNRKEGTNASAKISRRMNDYNIFSKYRDKLDWKLSNKFTDEVFSELRNSPYYKESSKRKKTLGRFVANRIVDLTKKHSGNAEFVLAIENLGAISVSNNVVSETGLKNFFLPKKESKWIIQSIYECICDLAPQRGINVLKVNPRNTSITCPCCGSIDSKNRYKEQFKCLKCNHERNSDIDIAPVNILRKALEAIKEKSVSEKTDPLTLEQQINKKKITTGVKSKNRSALLS